MAERPILFSSEMIRAILENRKTQTRRIIKPSRGWEKHSVCNPAGAADPWAVWWHYPETDRVGHLQACPYGVPGDRLWVRETWRVFSQYDAVKPSELAGLPEMAGLHYESDGPALSHHGRLRRSIHMPRWASRIALEITDVRVERLNDISEADAEAEGCRGVHFAVVGGHISTARSEYRDLWNKINGADSWAANPWVWVIRFQRAPQKEGR